MDCACGIGVDVLGEVSCESVDIAKDGGGGWFSHLYV